MQHKVLSISYDPIMEEQMTNGTQSHANEDNENKRKN